MGRSLPTECEHGAIIDWGDFGDGASEPEPCRECVLANVGVTEWRSQPCLLDHPHPPLPSGEGYVRFCISGDPVPLQRLRELRDAIGQGESKP